LYYVSSQQQNNSKNKYSQKSFGHFTMLMDFFSFRTFVWVFGHP